MILERLQLILGHHRDGGQLLRLDVAEVDRQDFVGSLHGDGVGILPLDDAGDRSAVAEAEHRRHVILRNHGARVEDVFQQVIEVGPV